jgi:hypothetical protein
LLLAFAAFAIANLIHNNFGLDPAIVPAALLVGLYLWRPRRWLLWGAAIMIALPSFVFLRWDALVPPAVAIPFLNHVALLAAGALAVLGVVISVMPDRRLSQS